MTIADKVAFTPTRGPDRSRLALSGPPKTGRTEQLSITARDQSIFPIRGKLVQQLRNGSNPKFRPAPNLSPFASRTCRSRNLVFLAASATEYRYGAQKSRPRGKPRPPGAVAPHAA